MRPLVSCIHASYGRPAKALECRRVWMDRAVNPDRIEYVFALNLDDPELDQYEKPLRQSQAPLTTITKGFFNGSAPAWNAGWMASTGIVLVQVSDDLDPQINWDAEILKRIEAATSPGWDEKPTFLAVSDGYRKDRLCTAAIMTAAYARQRGSFVPPEFKSVHSDGEVTFRAYTDAAEGLVTLIEARDIVFRHNHHYNNPKQVPWDSTYARGNSPQNYEEGRKLFFERNPAAVGNPIVDWL